MAGSVINRGGNHWELRVSLGYKDGKQKRKTKRIIATSRRAAQKEADLFYLEVTRNIVDEQYGDMTFGDFAKVWCEKHNANLAMTTRITHQQILNDRILDVFKGVPLAKISSEDVMDFLDNLRDIRIKDRKGQSGEMVPLSDTTIHKHFKLLNHMLSMAVEWHMLGKNPCDDIPKRYIPKPDYKHHPIWQEADLRRFLTILEEMPNTPVNISHKAMFYLALETGVRWGELSALTWKDIDWKNHAISINKSYKYIDGHHSEISEPKTKASVRTLYVDAYVMKLLQMHNEYQLDDVLNRTCRNNHRYIFIAGKDCNGESKPMTPNALYLWLKNMCKGHNLPPITVHSIRHMSATYALNNGASLTTVQVMLGHTDIRITSVYLHALDEKRKESANILSEAFSNMRNGK